MTCDICGSTLPDTDALDGVVMTDGERVCVICYPCWKGAEADESLAKLRQRRIVELFDDDVRKRGGS